MYDRQEYIKSHSPLRKVLYRLFKSTDALTLMDIGGCEGEDSIKYSRLFPNAKIFVFEPLPENQLLIRENLEKYHCQNVELIAAGLSDQAGRQKFYISSGKPATAPDGLDWDFGNKSSSLLPPGKAMNAIPWLKFEEAIDVPIDTLDAFTLARHITEIDFIHMDVQGSEMNVLRGGENILSATKVVWVEVADVPLYDGQPLRKDIEQHMKGKGFKLVQSVMTGDFGDQLYINRQHFLAIFFMNQLFALRRN